ncbi:unnamed protein product [Orchesella dallaii]|uniref:Uncharacterized protein n=1 Tax=Orchesella dallaii TaxID=48710 RepID=A0ABP1QXX2_9HEXA
MEGNVHLLQFKSSHLASSNHSFMTALIDSPKSVSCQHITSSFHVLGLVKMSKNLMLLDDRGQDVTVFNVEEINQHYDLEISSTALEPDNDTTSVDSALGIWEIMQTRAVMCMLYKSRYVRRAVISQANQMIKVAEAVENNPPPDVPIQPYESEQLKLMSVCHLRSAGRLAEQGLEDPEAFKCHRCEDPITESLCYRFSGVASEQVRRISERAITPLAPPFIRQKIPPDV